MMSFPQINSLEQKYTHHVVDVHDVRSLQQFLRRERPLSIVWKVLTDMIIRLLLCALKSTGFACRKQTQFLSSLMWKRSTPFFGSTWIDAIFWIPKLALWWRSRERSDQEKLLVPCIKVVKIERRQPNSKLRNTCLGHVAAQHALNSELSRHDGGALGGKLVRSVVSEQLPGGSLQALVVYVLRLLEGHEGLGHAQTRGDVGRGKGVGGAGQGFPAGRKARPWNEKTALPI